jgi:hypothetical protein
LCTDALVGVSFESNPGIRTLPLLIMFGYEEDNDEPKPSDVGKFISQGDLEAWWGEMARKYPPDVWGDDPCPKQHAQGTKLMTYFDDDPSKPMRIEILGSKFKVDFQGNYAFYVVRFKGQTELTMIHWTAGHEEWKLGWDVPPPS